MGEFVSVLVEKVQDTSSDGLPLGSVLIWRGEWDRSPADVSGRDRDAAPVLYRPGGDRVGPTGASDWVEVLGGGYPEAWRIPPAVG